MGIAGGDEHGQVSRQESVAHRVLRRSPRVCTATGHATAIDTGHGTMCAHVRTPTPGVRESGASRRPGGRYQVPSAGWPAFAVVLRACLVPECTIDPTRSACCKEASLKCAAARRSLHAVQFQALSSV